MADNSPDKINFIYNSQLDAFTLYHVSQENSTHNAIGPALPALGHATSGALGSAISKLITYPVDLVVTRLQVQRQLQHGKKHPHYDGVVDAFLKVYEREGGLKAFYSGCAHETFKGVVDSFLFFLAYSYVREKRLSARGSSHNLPALEEIGVGVIAGAFSKLISTPLQQVVTRKQTAAMMNQGSTIDPPPPLSTKDITSEIWREKGIQGFWSGYSASLILTLNPSITMLLHKALLRLVVPRAKRSDPGGRLTFLLAAISKALASTVTYPFSLAKARAQVSAQKPLSGSGETSDREKSEEPVKSRALQARQRTVFSTILRIAQTEGIRALYEGLGGEVLKGFFSHGITMLMKDHIHSVIISLYFTLQKALRKYPGPEEIAKSASEGVQDMYVHSKDKGIEAAENVTKSAKDIVEKGKEQVAGVYSKGAEVAETASRTARDALESGSQHVEDVAKTVRDGVGDASQQAADGITDSRVKDIDGTDKDMAK
ncbi:hypothetical protein COCVIDRAFT_26748 [Bipolaris victoriae FI3]|uniref:Mitochondrial carrier n=1 Tax=Bipolaris victoriae (strain FI3) TaxID=930091 RepID=W7EM62_BIPV3|nr:hypothetical protein COCVIDRAFT_26748 [Bipolaris victoriae FI3]